MDPKQRCYTHAKVAQAADLDPDTVRDWTDRGLVKVEGPEPYSALEAIRFTAVRSLVGHLLPVYRAAEIVRIAEEQQPTFWTKTIEDCAQGKRDHVFLYVAAKGAFGFGVFLLAWHSANPPDPDFSDASEGELTPAGETVDEMFAAYTKEMQDPERPFNRVARYDISGDIRRAVRVLGL